MRLLAVTLLCVTALTAQRGMGGFGRPGGVAAPGGFTGHGRGMGGGIRGGYGFRPPAPGRPVHGFARGAYYRGGYGYARPVYGGAWGWGTSYWPYGWYSPMWTSPSVYPAWDPYPYNAAPNVVIVTVPSASPQPSYDVVERTISSNHRPASAPAPAPAPPLVTKSWAYLIAAADGTIWLARDYRLDGNMLHFATTGDNWRSLPLASVDASLTERLNRERGVAVDLR